MELRVWSIVLAADVQPPASVVGKTVARLASICPGGRVVIVLHEGHREHVRGLRAGPESGRMIFQPHDRGTAAGLLYGLLPVLTTDPAAVVVVAPSTKAVEDIDGFRQGIVDAVAYARRRFGAVLFVGRRGVPTSGVWNAGVIVASARALFHLCRQRLPLVSSVFVGALTMPFETQQRFLAARYPQLPSRDLARHVLMASANSAASMGPPSMGGSDPETPRERGSRRDPAQQTGPGDSRSRPFGYTASQYLELI